MLGAQPSLLLPHEVAVGRPALGHNRPVKLEVASYAVASLRRNEKDWVTMARLAVYNVMNGNVEEGLAGIRTAVTEGAFLDEVHYYNAVILAQLGQDAPALDALQQAIDRGYPVRSIAADPQFIEFRSDARFARMIEEQ